MDSTWAARVGSPAVTPPRTVQQVVTEHFSRTVRDDAGSSRAASRRIRLRFRSISRDIGRLRRQAFQNGRRLKNANLRLERPGERAAAGTGGATLKAARRPSRRETIGNPAARRVMTSHCPLTNLRRHAARERPWKPWEHPLEDRGEQLGRLVAESVPMRVVFRPLSLLTPPGPLRGRSSRFRILPLVLAIQPGKQLLLRTPPALRTAPGRTPVGTTWRRLLRTTQLSPACTDGLLEVSARERDSGSQESTPVPTRSVTRAHPPCLPYAWGTALATRTAPRRPARR